MLQKWQETVIGPDNINSKAQCYQKSMFFFTNYETELPQKEFTRKSMNISFVYKIVIMIYNY
jgi:hypothetical protein